MQCIIYTLQCAGCSVLPAKPKDIDLAVETGNFNINLGNTSAKSTFLVIDKKSMCKYIPKVRDRH